TQSPLPLNNLPDQIPSPISAILRPLFRLMSVSAKKFFLVLIVAALGLTGCTKKPVRPDPSATMMGQSGGAGYADGSMLNPNDLAAGDMFGDANSGLSPRDGVIETEDMIRGLLEPVYFDFDQSGIKASERVKLEAAIDYLNQNPQYRLL